MHQECCIRFPYKFAKNPLPPCFVNCGEQSNTQYLLGLTKSLHAGDAEGWTIVWYTGTKCKGDFAGHDSGKADERRTCSLVPVTAESVTYKPGSSTKNYIAYEKCSGKVGAGKSKVYNGECMSIAGYPAYIIQ